MFRHLTDKGILSLSLPLSAMLLSQTSAQNAPLPAPEFPKVEWLNTDKPLSLADLRGQVVLLDFWTYCCINCMHIFPDLKYLEDKYRGQPFVVIGVHSGKFSQEKDLHNIRQAILRNDITHPVAVDSDYAIWNAYHVNVWPTLVVIDPQGNIVGAVTGEGHRELLDKTIGQVLAQGRIKGTLAAAPLEFKLEREAFKPGVLDFPAKVLADAAGGRLFISDTGHNRVLVADLRGRVQVVIGSGEAGLADGRYADTRFHQPQGLALSEDGKTLYIADTENHAVRAVELDDHTVSTLAGTGKQAQNHRPNGVGKQVGLSSPWDLARVGDKLYIAMAGTHQIWICDLKTKRVTAFAGTGREACIDGPARSAAFAQPSGLATDGKHLYVADAESSSIRVIDLGRHTVRTLAGSGELFGFGSQDGVGPQARFQHPLGVALDSKRLFVADSFNQLIRSIDINSGQVGTFLGTGKPGPGTADAISFYEPGGISVSGNTLYIADTNNHRIIAVDIPSKKVQVLQVVAPSSGPA